MKKFFALFIVAIFSFAPLSVLAQDLPTSTSNSLSIVRALADEPRAVDIVFSEDVDLATIRTTIENAVSGASIPVLDYTSLPNNSTIRVLLSEDLTTSTTYKLTVNSAISKQGKTINAGVDAIREFVTPTQFIIDSEESLNAPSNTSLAVVNTTTSESSAATTLTDSRDSNSSTASGAAEKNELSPEVKELPATGAETAIIAFIVLAIAALIMFAKRRTA